MKSRKHNAAHAIAAASTLLCLAVFTQGCDPAGGCTFNDSSDVVVTPETSCLELHASTGSDGDPQSFGCVRPTLYGVNRCSEPLVLPAEGTYDGTGLVVQPDESFTHTVLIGAKSGDKWHQTIDAELGGNSIVIEWDVYAP